MWYPPPPSPYPPPSTLDLLPTVSPVYVVLIIGMVGFMLANFAPSMVTDGNKIGNIAPMVIQWGFTIILLTLAGTMLGLIPGVPRLHVTYVHLAVAFFLFVFVWNHIVANQPPNETEEEAKAKADKEKEREKQKEEAEAKAKAQAKEKEKAKKKEEKEAAKDESPWDDLRSHPSAFLTTKFNRALPWPFPLGRAADRGTELWWESGTPAHLGHFNKPEIDTGPTEEQKKKEEKAKAQDAAPAQEEDKDKKDKSKEGEKDKGKESKDPDKEKSKGDEKDKTKGDEKDKSKEKDKPTLEDKQKAEEKAKAEAKAKAAAAEKEAAMKAKVKEEEERRSKAAAVAAAEAAKKKAIEDKQKQKLWRTKYLAMIIGISFLNKKFGFLLLVLFCVQMVAQEVNVPDPVQQEAQRTSNPSSLPSSSSSSSSAPSPSSSSKPSSSSSSSSQPSSSSSKPSGGSDDAARAAEKEKLEKMKAMKEAEKAKAEKQSSSSGQKSSSSEKPSSSGGKPSSSSSSSSPKDKSSSEKPSSSSSSSSKEKESSSKSSSSSSDKPISSAAVREAAGSKTVTHSTSETGYPTVGMGMHYIFTPVKGDLGQAHMIPSEGMAHPLLTSLSRVRVQYADENASRRASIKRVKREKLDGAAVQRTPAETPSIHEEEEDDLVDDSSSSASENEPIPEYGETELIDALESVRAKQGKYVGQTSEAGVIKQIVVVDFMCHRHLSMKLGPKMNFIVGHNGSGKSAVLTAIAVALGGKAAITGRGQGLRDLIRKGADKATITVTLANEGIEAYKPEIYNPTIVIERTIDVRGSGQYKFKSTKDGKVIAKGRDELSAILANFNITVDSPLTILTQDQARSFLQNATEHSLYQYGQLESTINGIMNLIIRHREALPDLEAKHQVLVRKAQASRKIVELKDKEATLKRQLAWAYVAEKERHLAEAKDDLVTAQKRVDEAGKQIEEKSAEHEETDHQVEALVAAQKDFEKGRQSAVEARATAQRKLNEASRHIAGEDESIKETEASLAESNKEKKDLEARIHARQTQANGVDPEDAALRSRIEKLEALRSKLSREDVVRRQNVETKGAALRLAQDDVIDLDFEFTEKEKVRNEQTRTLQSLQSQSRDSLAAYGVHVDMVLDEIKKAKWVHSPPVGPLGQYVKLNDPAYGRAFCSIMGTTLCGFAVSHPRDKDTLNQILRRCGPKGYKPYGGAAPVIQHSGDMFDFSQGDLRRLNDTVLSKLTITNEAVLRILIVQHNIEKVFVVPSVQDFKDTIPRLLNSIPSCTVISADSFRGTGRRTSGQPSLGSGPLGKWPGLDLFSRDMASEIARCERELQVLTDDRTKLLDKRRDLTNHVRNLESEIANERRAWDKARQGLVSSALEIEKAQDKLAEKSSTDFGGDQLLLDEIRQRIEVEERQLEAMLGQKRQLEEKLTELKEQFEQADEALEQFIPEQQRRQNAVQTMLEKRAQLAAHIASLKHKRETDYSVKLKVVQERLERNQYDLENMTAQATGFCPTRMDSDKPPAEIRRQTDAISAAIKEAEKRNGADTENIMAALNASEKKLAEIRLQIKHNTLLRKELHASLKDRKKWWNDIRAYSAIRAKGIFLLNLSRRDLEGRLDFDHAKETLDLESEFLVSLAEGTTPMGREEKQPDNQIASSGAQEAGQTGPSQRQWKKAKALSGGERSLTTVSLLLAFWEMAASPLRCLDEWDVFLDHINRGAAAKNLIDGAKESDGKQYILITPQDMAGISLGDPTNKIIKMGDPARNQALLNFAPV
ncbi:hypothetical protein TREMEDRAFT_59633 [Tremella mesenterica DSM 1558]|uniref:uncharacterized protein n=1 Tax=Tremella mesenterica (strain ATCC 24925 / CBS 8224 / DSM 1558 / NBRC 9311 / NRRL Y-6157 / RJB 2259-6 / UBC 559-6) TaxID=578456 RepID=UPI0003F49BE2|nr:uncharacterized protein TREMEDRAFT_59633 [Tremella mesenterica DSM 1558]EIW73465.1 hypothetical protein TREMEDRAFT_59633 [Tremella mesenterica DSM 1558]